MHSARNARSVPSPREEPRPARAGRRARGSGGRARAGPEAAPARESCSARLSAAPRRPDDRRASSSIRIALGASVAKIGRSSVEHAVLPSALPWSPPRSTRSTRKRTNGTDARDGARDRLGALALHELGGIGARRQRDDAQLELAFRGQRRRRAASPPGRRCRRPARAAPWAPSRELADLLVGERGAHQPTALRSRPGAAAMHVGVALAQDHLRRPAAWARARSAP